MLARALAGLGIGGTWGAGQAMLGETFPPALRGRYGALAQSGAPAGLGLAAIVGSFIAPSIGWRPVFLLSAAPVLVLLAWRRLPESDLWLEHRRPLRAGGLEGASWRAPGGRSWLSSWAADLAGLFTRAFMLTGLNMSAYWFAVVWLPRYLRSTGGSRSSAPAGGR